VLSRVAYGYVAADGPLPDCAVRKLDAGVAGYLEQHITRLARKGEDGTSPPGWFRGDEARGRFDFLRAGTDAEFDQTAQEFAERLFQRMDQRATRGFVVVARRVIDNAGVFAAVLKLDVQDERAAHARQRQSGELVLEEVEDLLDIPGKLQKGALGPDGRAPHSEVVLGDRLSRPSQYFLDALDVRQIEDPGRGALSVIKVVSDVAPDRTSAVAARIEGSARTSVADFFRDNDDLLTPEQVAEVEGHLVRQPRPVEFMDPAQRAIFMRVRADAAEVKLPRAAYEERLEIYERDGGGWRIVIDVDEEPRVDVVR
jgi:hypothetical protein